jgi:hypothetical protein
MIPVRILSEFQKFTRPEWILDCSEGRMESRHASRDVFDSEVHSEFSPRSMSGECMRSLLAVITSPAEPPQKSQSCRDLIRPSRAIMVTIVNKCRRFRLFSGYIMIDFGLVGLTEIIASHLEWSEQIRYFGGLEVITSTFLGWIKNGSISTSLSLFQWATI